MKIKLKEIKEINNLLKTHSLPTLENDVKLIEISTRIGKLKHLQNKPQKSTYSYTPRLVGYDAYWAEDRVQNARRQDWI